MAEILDAIEFEDETVLCLRYNPDYDNPFTTAWWNIEEQFFSSAHFFKSEVLAVEDFYARVDSQFEEPFA